MREALKKKRPGGINFILAGFFILATGQIFLT